MLSDPDELLTHESDGLTLHALADFVVFPRPAEQGAAVATLANPEGLPFVARGAVTGLPGGGATGLAIGDHRRYEVLVHGVSVPPVEWWDAEWIHDRDDAPLRASPRTGWRRRGRARERRFLRHAPRRGGDQLKRPLSRAS